MFLICIRVVYVRNQEQLRHLILEMLHEFILRDKARAYFLLNHTTLSNIIPFMLKKEAYITFSIINIDLMFWNTPLIAKIIGK